MAKPGTVTVNVKVMREPITQEELDNRFTYHPPQPESGDVEFYSAVREDGRLLAMTLLHGVAHCEEQVIAIQKIEEAVMWANAGRARHGAA